MPYLDHADYQDTGHLDFSDHSDSWENNFSDHSDVSYGDAAHGDVAHIDGYPGGAEYTFQDYSGMGPCRYWHMDNVCLDCLSSAECEGHETDHNDTEGCLESMQGPVVHTGSCNTTSHGDAGNLPGKTQCDLPWFYDYTDYGDYADHSDVAHTDSAHADSVHADYNDSTQSGDHFDGTSHQDTEHEDATTHSDIAPPPGPTDLSAAAVM